MIDYASIKPMMSLSTFILLMMAVLFIGVVIVELSELTERRKARETLADVQQAGRQRLTPSQKCIQRYYSTRRKGA